MSLVDPDSGAALRGARTGVQPIDPLSMGVVIGVGGSGVQTISRVRSAVVGGRPDAAATPSIRFLGIDAVDLTKQYPNLPPGVSLAAGEFVNLTERTFDAEAYVRRIGASESDLQRWWDVNYSVPAGPLTDGLKQSRMLGRLAFYRESANITTEIHNAMSQAIRLRRAHMEAGIVGTDTGASMLKVFIVASTCGGTGSAGFLEVLHKSWVAARELGIIPEIRAFLYMPGVFEDSVQRSSAAPMLEKRNQEANGFAFLREVDHFVVHSDQLEANVCRPRATMVPAEIPPGQALKQVFLIDATMGGMCRLSRVTDFYEIVAEAIYQFVMTEAGRPQIAQNGTNTDDFLRMLDGHSKRRIYCGLGIAGVTYPGDTYRRHLRARFGEWAIRNLLLPRPIELPTVVHDSESLRSLQSELSSLHSSVLGYDPPDEVTDFRAITEFAPENLQEEPEQAVVTRLMTSSQAAAPRAVKAIQDRMRVVADQALAKVEPLIIDTLTQSGQGVPFGIEMAKSAERAIDKLVSSATEVRAMHQHSGGPRAEEEMEERRRRFQSISGRLVRLPGSKEKAAVQLGEAIKAWGAAVVGEQEAEGELRFLESARGRLQALRNELEEAERQLQKLAAAAYEAWTSDELIGKDTGPEDTTVLIPPDTVPEVRHSRLAVQAFRDLIDKVSVLDSTELLRDLYRHWRHEGEGRGPFALGSSNGDEQEQARRALADELRLLSDEHALEAGRSETQADGSPTGRLLLPRSLADAAERTPDGHAILDRSLQGLARLSAQTTLAWDKGRLGNVEVEPATSTVVVAPAALRPRVTTLIGDEGAGRSILDSPDEERVVAMTTEWGISAHAVAPVISWQRPYLSALEASARDSVSKRPHLDKRWANNLDPLVPLYYDQDRILTCVGSALAFAKLLREEEIHSFLFGSSMRGKGRPAPIETRDEVDHVDYQGCVYRFDETNRVWMAVRTLHLGSTHSQIVARTGEESDFSQSLEAITRALIEQAGRKRAIEAVKEYCAVLVSLLDGNNLPAPEEGTVRAIHDALVDLRVRYELTSLTAGDMAGS